MPLPSLAPVTLLGTHVRLVPLAQEHHDALVAATQDGQLYDLWFTAVPSPSEMRQEMDRRLAFQRSGQWLPFTVIDQSSGQPVGMTNYLNIDSSNRRLEIGGTWYASRVQRTPLNTEAKSLLLQHAFETLECVAVEFRTHALNQRSRRAIERLGAKLDGIMRAHMVLKDGTLRDTCVYSITAAEWPTVKAYLAWQKSRTYDRSALA